MQAGIGKTSLLSNWSTVDMFFIGVLRREEKTLKHIRRAPGLEEEPDVSHRESHQLALGATWTQSSAARWQQPHEHDLAGTMREAPQAPGWEEPSRRRDGRSTQECGGNNLKRFGEIWGLKWKTFLIFFIPLFFNVEMTQCEEEDESGQDTDSNTDRDLILLQI